MKIKHFCPMLTLTVTLLLGFAQMQATAQTTPHGPVSDFQIFYYADDTALYGALKVKEVDMNCWETTPAQYEDAINDPMIQLAPVPRFDFRAMSLNSNETIDAYKGVKNPLTNVNFRKAIHRLSNRDYWVSTICQGFATKLPVTIAAPSSGWWNTSVVDFVEGNAPDRYPYPYESLTFNRDAAKALLDDAGFTDVEPDGIRNYPANWPGRPGRPNLDLIKFSIRNDDVLRKAAGQDLAAELRAAGIPVDEMLQNYPAAYTQVMSARNYHIYTAGWGVTRFPTYLWSWFHSSRWFPGGSNYHLSTTPIYADVDELTDKVMYPPSYEAAMKAAKDAQYLLTEKYCVMVPGWSAKAFYPFSSDLLAVTNMQAVGPENDYTYLKAYKPGGGPVRAGLKAPPLEVNQIYSRWIWDASTMSPFMMGFYSNPPYNVMVDQPGLAQDWTSPPQTWDDGGVTKSKMTFWFRDEAKWIEPVTGNVLANFSSQWIDDGGYEFNCWYYSSEPAGWIYGNYRDIHHIRTYPAERKVEVYFNVLSYWSMYWAMGRLIYAPAWKKAPLATFETRTFTGPIAAHTDLSLPHKTIGAPIEIANITRSDTGLMKKANTTYNNYYEMVLGKIRLYTDIPAGVSITAKYWARGDPAGYAPGSLFRSDRPGVGEAWIGCGTHYVTDHVPGAGGWTTYKKNPNYCMETPPKGEIDFWWNWISGPKPRDGYYLVDILDVVRATWAIDGEGYRVPSPNWEPGADLSQAVRKCKITVNDIVIVTGDYGKIFGSPSPNPPP